MNIDVNSEDYLDAASSELLGLNRQDLEYELRLQSGTVYVPPEQVDVETTEAHRDWNVNLRAVDILDSRIAAFPVHRIRRNHGIWPSLFYYGIEVGLDNSFYIARKHLFLHRLRKEGPSEQLMTEVHQQYTYKDFRFKLVEQ